MKFKSLFIALATVCCVSCTSDEDAPNRVVVDSYFTPEEIPAEEIPVYSATNNFAWDLFREINQETNGNFIVSPINASIALTAIANGTDSETQQEILSTLGYQALDMAAVNSFIRRSLRRMSTIDPNTTVNYANSMWSSVNLKEDFVSVLSNGYDVESYSIVPGQVVKDINSWCARKSNGMINELFKHELPIVFAVLNCTYFKSIWSPGIYFDKKNTQKAKFHNVNGSTSKVEFMCAKLRPQVMHTNHTTVCRLDFGNHAYRLWLILPNEGISIDKAIDDFCDGKYNPESSYATIDYNVKIPKFEIESSFNLKEVTKSLGICKLFDRSADLSAITDDELEINLMYQSAKFKIDEAGAEGAAVTIVGDQLMMPEKPTSVGDLVFDRPFIYLVEGYGTGTILFMGKVDSL